VRWGFRPPATVATLDKEFCMKITLEVYDKINNFIIKSHI